MFSHLILSLYSTVHRIQGNSLPAMCCWICNHFLIFFCSHYQHQQFDSPTNITGWDKRIGSSIMCFVSMEVQMHGSMIKMDWKATVVPYCESFKCSIKILLVAQPAFSFQIRFQIIYIQMPSPSKLSSSHRKKYSPYTFFL